MENPLKIAICEDTDADARRLQLYAEQSGLPLLCERFESDEAFLHSFHAGRYDLVFMDIYMNNAVQGIKAAEAIRETDELVMLAFTTSSLDHTLESYRLKALMYLEKPVKAEDVKETLELALMKRKSLSLLTLTAAGGQRKDIPLDSILYFEQKNHVVEVHTASGVFVTSQSARMDEIEERLPRPPFLRCHRSFMVNL